MSLQAQQSESRSAAASVRDLHVTFATDAEPVQAVTGISLEARAGEVLPIRTSVASSYQARAKSSVAERRLLVAGRMRKRSPSIRPGKGSWARPST